VTPGTWTPPETDPTQALVASFLERVAAEVRAGNVLGFDLSWDGGFEVRSRIKCAGTLEQIVLSGVIDDS
jgi:hypothetical protein